jgi:hypothetical protein
LRTGSINSFWTKETPLAMRIAVPAQPQCPQILQIYRESLHPERQAAYNAVEEDTARSAMTLGCPHPYLAAESANESTDVWWFNGYQSSAEQKQVYAAYARNHALMAALRRNSKRKAPLTFNRIQVLARYRKDLSVGTPWILGHGRFLVVVSGKNIGRMPGAVFDATDGTRLVVASAQASIEADAARALAGPDATVLSIRPSWSFPAEEWRRADPVFWRTNASELPGRGRGSR